MNFCPWVTENINSRAAGHILAVSSFAAQADAYFEIGESREFWKKAVQKEEKRETAKFKMRGKPDGKEPGTGQSSKVAENEMKMCTK